MTTIYLKIDKNVKVESRDFRLKEIARILCQDKTVEAKAGLLRIPSGRMEGRGGYVYSALEMIDLIQTAIPDVQVENLGETDFIITLEPKGKPSPIWQWIKTGAVCLLCFFGAAFSIMAFHNDVDITGLWGRLYVLFTGESSDGFTILEITYSLGLGLGILLFFRHFGKRKTAQEPTPLEVQMRLYEDEIDTTLIAEDGRGK